MLKLKPPTSTQIVHHFDAFARQVQFSEAGPAVEPAQAICQSEQWIFNHLAGSYRTRWKHQRDWLESMIESMILMIVHRSRVWGTSSDIL